MKTIQDVINAVNKSERSRWHFSSDEMVNVLHIGYDVIPYYLEEKHSQRIEAYRVPGATWLCTDTWVGLSVLYLDDEPIGILSQHGRRHDIDITFLSEDSRNKLDQFIKDIMESPTSRFDIVSPESELPPGWTNETNPGIDPEQYINL